MAQKTLFKNAKRKPKAPAAANRHGKALKTRKGGITKAPKGGLAKERFDQDQELTKTINLRNEREAASRAAQKGGQLAVVRAKDADK